MFLFLILSFALTCAPADAAAIPAGSTVAGKTLGEWSAQWWQWALSFPAATNPVLDTTGNSASLGDVGPVFFLAGTFSSTPVTRTFAVPAGKFIFFPLLSGFLSEEGSVADMRARLATFVGNTTELHASIDGVNIPNLFSHREVSPVFDITLGPDNIFAAPPRVYTPSVSDGYWLMLEPLPSGNHTIRFGGTSEGNSDPTLGDLTVDVTYVVPEASTFLLALYACVAIGVTRKLSRG
ncbi:MAG: hypothetical protein WKF37_03755 [Bryobacteraceae bacterium]